jgi:hypothetical protein
MNAVTPDKMGATMVRGMLMQRTHIYRYPPRRNRTLQLGCGCLLAAGFAALLGFTALYALSPLFSGMGFQVLGLRQVGQTDRIFANAPIVPTAIVQNASQPQQVTVNLGAYGSQTVNVDPQHYAIVTGNSESGASIARASFSEAGLLAICAQQSPICQNGNQQYRNVSIDLRPGGAIVYVDVNASGLLWQRIGVVFQLDSSRTALVVRGIDLNGGLYDYSSLPGELSGAVDEIGRVTNDILRQLAVEASGENYRLSEIIIDDTTLTLILR